MFPQDVRRGRDKTDQDTYQHILIRSSSRQSEIVDGSRVGVVLATCDVARYGANFALGVAGVQDLIAAKRSSKVAHGFMVAASVDKFNALSYVDHKEIEEFNAVLLQKLRPRTSEYGGEYWLLTPAMITNCAVVEDDEAF